MTAIHRLNQGRQARLHGKVCELHPGGEGT